MTLGGVICLLSIEYKREKNMNLDMFRQFFRDKTSARVVLGTTNWRKVDQNETKFQIREQQLAESWKTTTASGPKLLRFYETDSSARALLDALLDNVLQTRNVLDKNFFETTASQVLPSMPKQRDWKKKDRMIKTDDNVMVGGLPTDIVIP